MSRSGKTPDGTQFIVRRPLLPAAFLSNAVTKSTEYPSSSSSTASPLAQMLFKAVLLLVLGIVLIPISGLFRIALRRWTVQANVGSSERQWRARSRSDAGEGVKAIAEALKQGASLDQQFAGLTAS